MAVLLKVISGFFSTSKNASERRCLSRSGLPVLTEAAFIVKETFDAEGLAWSMLTVAANSSNLPLTLLIMWRISNFASEWTLSTTKVSAAKLETATNTRAMALTRCFFIRHSLLISELISVRGMRTVGSLGSGLGRAIR